MSLWQLFQNNQGNIIHKWNHYFPIYERYFSRYINQPINFLEIGVFKGGSLNMWKNYFGPNARIIGIDINPECKIFETPQINVRIGDQSDTKFLNSIVDEFGAFDIILDDGSHQMHDILTSFNFLYPNLKNNGVYFIEDLHTAYWEEYGGGLGVSESFIEHSKNLVDQLNADHIREGLKPNEFTKQTNSIHFYDSCIIFEKGLNLEKYAPQIGKLD